MKSYKFLFILSILLSLFQLNQAQVNQGIIKGYIHNPDNEPSEYSTVVLMNQDSVFMGGTLTAAMAHFYLKR